MAQLISELINQDGEVTEALRRIGLPLTLSRGWIIPYVPECVNPPAELVVSMEEMSGPHYEGFYEGYGF